MSGSTQRPEWELHAFPGPGLLFKEEAGVPVESPAPTPTCSRQLSGSLKDSGARSSRGDAKRGGDWDFHPQ